MSKVSKEQENTEEELDELLGTTTAQEKQDALEKKEADAAAKERKKKRKAADKAAAASGSTPAADSKLSKIAKKQVAPVEEEDEDKEEDDDEYYQHQIQFGDHAPVSINSVALEESLAREEIQARENLLLRQENETLRLNGNKPVNDGDLTSNLYQEPVQSFIYNNDVLSLDQKVNRQTVIPFCNQFRQKEFSKNPLELIFPSARRLISAKFIESGDCEKASEWLSWSKEKIIETLHKRYESEKCISDVDTLSKLRGLSLGIYFGRNDSPEGQKLIEKVFKIVEEMSTEELGNYQLQKQFVKLFWDLLSRKDESKILLDVKVGECKTLEDFLKLFSRYRVNLNIKIQDLEKNGVKVEPKVFLLNSADPLLEKKGDKKKKFDHEKHTSDEKYEKTPREKKLKTEFTTVLDPNIKPCEACGRQE